MSISSLRSRAALTAIATSAAVAVPAIGVLTSASAAATRGAQHVSAPSNFVTTQLVAIPHSSAVAILGRTEKTGIAGLEVPSGSHYVLRSFGKKLYPSKVVAVSKSSYWAIATTPAGHNEVLRLSGSKWSAVKMPAAAAKASFASITASSPTNVWVSGYLPATDGSGEQVLHWNGHAWSISSLGDTTDTTVYAIGTSGPANVWAVDGDDVLHFNGKAWTHPLNEELGAVNAVDTISPSNTWFLAANGNGPAITHWNGKSFKLLPVPNAKNVGIQSLSIAGSAAWIAGYTRTAKGASHEIVLRSTGSKWKIVRTPAYKSASAQSIVASSGSSAVVAVDETTGTSCTNYRTVPILLGVNASRTTVTAKGKAFRSGCG